jgi:cell wall-associated NlpC family hydrolase
VADGALDLKLTATGGPASIATIQIERLTTPGEAIVAYALQYVGYPYVWATSGPNSFDCSGFTNWVVSHVLGVQIGLNQLEQIYYGVEVPKDQLQPGDLVFFYNTHPTIPGVSHVGIYIGGGRVLHASSAYEGVIISDLTSGYYADHYYDAVRLAS